MAITDIKAYAHLTEADVEALAQELDQLRADIEESRGERDARYVRRTIQLQRALAAGGRIALFASSSRIARIGGTAMLAAAKIIENMELGHNVIHGQWDWMNDPEIHSSTWEWDTAQPAEQWKHSHNYVHHQFTNVLGHDNDIGYGILRMAREQKWHPANLGQPVYNALLATLFEWGVALHDLDIERILEAARACDAPVILQASRGARSYAGDVMLARMVEALLFAAPAPMAEAELVVDDVETGAR